MPLSHRELVAIESKAFELINKYNITEPPVDVERIAESLLLTVFPYSLDEVSGALIIENNQAYIGYNPTHGTQRRRFTIGHELGHYCLHCESSPSTIKKGISPDGIEKTRNFKA